MSWTTKEKETVLDLYQNHDLPVVEIAAAFGTHPVELYRLVRAAGLPTRREAQRARKAGRLEAALEEYRTNPGLRVADLLEKYGLTANSFYAVLDPGELRRPRLDERTVNAILDEYSEGGKTIADICDTWGISSTKLYSLIQAAGLPRRRRHRAELSPEAVNAILDEYSEGEKTIADICDTWEISPPKLYSLVQAAGLPRRRARRKVRLSPRAASAILDEYSKGEKTIADICDFWEISPTKLYSLVRAAGLPRRRTRSKLSRRAINAILDEYRQGFESVAEICDFWEISPTKLYSLVRAANIPLRREM